MPKIQKDISIEIEKIEKLYSTKKKYSLKKKLDSIYKQKLSLDSLVLQLKSTPEDHKLLDQLIRAEEKKLRLFKKISEKMKYEIDQFYLNGNNLPLNSVAKIQEISDSLSLSKLLQTVSTTYISSCKQFINKSRKPRSKRNHTYSIPRYYTQHLINVYHDMTDRMPECKPDRSLEKGEKGYGGRRSYKGKFYKFLLDINPILKKAYNINLGTNFTIGKNANELIERSENIARKK